MYSCRFALDLIHWEAPSRSSRPLGWRWMSVPTRPTLMTSNAALESYAAPTSPTYWPILLLRWYLCLTDVNLSSWWCKMNLDIIIWCCRLQLRAPKSECPLTLICRSSWPTTSIQSTYQGCSSRKSVNLSTMRPSSLYPESDTNIYYIILF